VVKISPEWFTGPVVGLLPLASGPACLRETGTGQQVAHLHERYAMTMMMMIMKSINIITKLNCEISGFRRGTIEVVGLLGCHAAFGSLPTFRDDISVQFER